MPVSISGTNGVTFPDSSLQAAAASPYVLKNRLINSAMVIDQRNAGASVGTASGTGAYTVDRWQIIYDQTNKFTAQQNAGSVTPPAGFTNYLGITSSSAYTVGSSEQFAVRQFIEGFNTADLAWGTANAQTVTLSFWVRSSLTGTFGGVIGGYVNTNSYPFTYTISSANTWEQKTITITGATAGTWNTGNSGGIGIMFGLGVGSTVSGTAGSWSASRFWSATGATSVVGTSGATFYITGVQLEIGTSATPFERRLYNQELANCQRYYYGWVAQQANTGVCTGQAYNGTTANGLLVKFPTILRSIPTLTTSSVSDFSLQNASAGALTATSISLAGACQSTDFALLSVQVASGLTAGNATFMFSLNTNGRLNFSAEL